MDLENLIITIYDEESELYLLSHPDNAVEQEKEDALFVEEAKKQIADYIKTFKRFPSKRIHFDNSICDAYRVRYISINPLENTVYCILEY